MTNFGSALWEAFKGRPTTAAEYRAAAQDCRERAEMVGQPAKALLQRAQWHEDRATNLELQAGK